MVRNWSSPVCLVVCFSLFNIACSRQKTEKSESESPKTPAPTANTLSEKSTARTQPKTGQTSDEDKIKVYSTAELQKKYPANSYPKERVRVRGKVIGPFFAENHFSLAMDGDLYFSGELRELPKIALQVHDEVVIEGTIAENKGGGISLANGRLISRKRATTKTTPKSLTAVEFIERFRKNQKETETLFVGKRITLNGRIAMMGDRADLWLFGPKGSSVLCGFQPPRGKMLDPAIAQLRYGQTVTLEGKVYTGPGKFGIAQVGYCRLIRAEPIKPNSPVPSEFVLLGKQHIKSLTEDGGEDLKKKWKETALRYHPVVVEGTVQKVEVKPAASQYGYFTAKVVISSPALSTSKVKATVECNFNSLKTAQSYKVGQSIRVIGRFESASTNGEMLDIKLASCGK